MIYILPLLSLTKEDLSALHILMKKRCGKYPRLLQVVIFVTIAINHYDADPSTIIGINVEIRNITDVKTDFVIVLSFDRWAEFRITFLVTTRRDLEFGTVRY